jgi:hypothetical protein
MCNKSREKNPIDSPIFHEYVVISMRLWSLLKLERVTNFQDAYMQSFYLITWGPLKLLVVERILGVGFGFPNQ